MVGFTPALRVSWRTSDTWSSTVSGTTVPSAPARAVLPDRCRYALFDERVGVNDEADLADAARAYVYRMEQEFGTGTVVTVDGGMTLV
jgi:hypothetical protein